jgi:hypothetical protein
MAGQAVVQNGYRILYENDGAIQNPPAGDDGGDAHLSGMWLAASRCIKQQPTGTYDNRGRMIYEDVPGAQYEYIENVGQEVLGLTDDEADWFFESGNDISRLKGLVNGIATIRNLPMPFPVSFAPETPHSDSWD